MQPKLTQAQNMFCVLFSSNIRKIEYSIDVIVGLHLDTQQPGTLCGCKGQSTFHQQL